MINEQQNNYSELHQGRIFNDIERKAKAKQIICIIEDYINSNEPYKKMSNLRVLDAGCSYGIMTAFWQIILHIYSVLISTKKPCN